MKIAKRILLFTLVLGLAIPICSIISPRSTHAIVATLVQVANTSANPVPVTGNVTATVTGTPTVNVASAPPVNVNFPPSIGINGPVSVQNAPGFFFPVPLIQQDFENPARSAFEETCASSSTGNTSCTYPPVPPNQILVIEMISGIARTIPSIPAANAVTLSTLTGGKEAQHFFVPVLLGPGTTGGFAGYAFSSPVKIYADPGSVFGVAVDTVDGLASNSIVSLQVTISGHHVCTTFQAIC